MRRSLFCVIALLLLATSAQAQVTRVQGVTFAGTNGTGTCAVSTGSNVTSGNRVVIGVKITADETLDASMISNTGTAFTWTLDAQYDVLGQSTTIGIASADVTASQALTVTFNPAAAAGRCGIGIVEFSGLGAYGSVVGQDNGTGTAVATSAFTPGAATGLAVAMLSSAQTQTWETDYATNAAEDITNARAAMAYDVDPAASAQQAESTQASGSWMIQAAWYAAAGGGGGSTCTGGMLTLGAGKSCE